MSVGTTTPAAASALGASRLKEWGEIARQLLRSPTFLAGALILGFWIFCALFGDLIVPYDPLETDLLAVLEPPSADHWFGADQLGRDVFSRVITGSRDILTVAPLATLLSTILGTLLGLVTGYFRGVVDDVLSRIIDALLSLPTVLIGLVALTSLGTSNTTVIFVIAFSFAPIIARTVRASVLSERELDYVAAARLRRESSLYIMLAEILPNVLPPILVEFNVRLGYAIFTVATLSFMGFGIQPPSPDWGLTISENYGLVGGGYWWTVIYDAVAIASLVVGVNLIADSIQGVLDG
ncbi:MAG TPA: ABC transporter permease [Hypericibacter adhaerens]|jgi:peptide/nickel transport system permease protein|uniref:Peptide ABC transporter permease n=1 Tax=Hypericibacter adhaerens TaxID=2602016 RepID=A0A5J6MVB8_9PROT|nr:ABC transporter permease [Hypericibacter adhaerens]QEX20675.1 peptide ABC transporter permease [Hypericibacter adhaerens]HWA43812.1 ABC transporter permease [Hypericibacter adhaerens]